MQPDHNLFASAAAAAAVVVDVVAAAGIGTAGTGGGGGGAVSADYELNVNRDNAPSLVLLAICYDTPSHTISHVLEGKVEKNSTRVVFEIKQKKKKKKERQTRGEPMENRATGEKVWM